MPDRLARPAPWTALGFVDSVERPAHADDLDTFILLQISSYRAVGHIGLGPICGPFTTTELDSRAEARATNVQRRVTLTAMLYCNVASCPLKVTCFTAGPPCKGMLISNAASYGDDKRCPGAAH
jgi:hypothetical protein